MRTLIFVLFCNACLAQTPSRLMTPQEFQAIPFQPPDDRIAYGREVDQFGELRVPPGAGPHPVVILLHGGCWRADFSNLHELGPIGDALKARGVATWNVEYRRLGQPGGGWPGTYLDVGRGIDYLRSIAAEKKLDLKRVIALGHSAGGHLALWAAARPHIPSGSEIHIPHPLPLRGVIDLAGTADMAAFFPPQRTSCGGRAVVEEMLGGRPADVPQHYASASALATLPLGIRQVVVWGKLDSNLPISFGEAYVEAAKRKGELIRFLKLEESGHFDIATPTTSSWPVVEKEILAMLADNE
jgi:acetyl esterase/lipase